MPSMGRTLKPRLIWSRAGQLQCFLLILYIVLSFVLMLFSLLIGAYLYHPDALFFYPVLLFVALLSLSIFGIVLLSLYRCTLYREITIFTVDPRDTARPKRLERRCIICRKHPISKNYHLKKMHGKTGINRRTAKTYFEHCGCRICFDAYTEG